MPGREAGPITVPASVLRSNSGRLQAAGSSSTTLLEPGPIDHVALQPASLRLAARALASACTSQEHRAVLERVPVRTLQQGLGNRALARILDRSRPALGFPELSRKSLGSESETASVARQSSTEGTSSAPPNPSVGEDDAREVHDGDTPVSASGGGVSGDLSAANTRDAGVSPSSDGGVTNGGSGTTPAPVPPPKTTPTTGPKKITKIDVDLSGQKLTLNWSDGTSEDHNISSGRGLPNTQDDPCAKQTEENCTPAGEFKVGTLGNAGTKNQHGDAMSWYVAFVDSRGIGIHDTQPVTGKPASHGCVRVGNTSADDAFAKKINQNVIQGKTIVHVFGKAPTKPWKKKVSGKNK